MYVRTVKVPSSSNNVNEYVRIVESYREDGKVKQRTIADLGRKDVLRALLPQLERVLKGLPKIEGQDDEMQVLQATTRGPVLVVRALFEQLGPDVVLTVGDRFETMATTLAAAYMNIPVAHTMGGEVSGTIDESIRHAVTKFAHIHFPASKEARERIIKLGELPEHVHMVGARGAVRAARWLIGRPPGLYGMDEVLGLERPGAG